MNMNFTFKKIKRNLAALAAALVMAGRVFRPAARLIAWAGVLTAVSILSAIAGSRWQAR